LKNIYIFFRNNFVFLILIKVNDDDDDRFLDTSVLVLFCLMEDRILSTFLFTVVLFLHEEKKKKTEE
jgi:hypothetical protein